MENQAFLINITVEPLSERHICWFTKKDRNDYTLYEVVEREYPHPQAPEHAKIAMVEVVRRGTAKEQTKIAAALHLLESVQKSVFNLREDFRTSLMEI